MFVIEHSNLSFLHERLRLEPSSNTTQITSNSESDLVVSIPRFFTENLAKRFAAEMLSKNLKLVLSHKALRDEQFIVKLMNQITLPMPQLLTLTDIETKEHFLSLVASSKSPQLLKYIDNQGDTQLTQRDINTVLYGVCWYASSDVLTYLVQTRDTLDINVRYGKSQVTPLMIASGTRDSQFIQQIMFLSPDLNACDGHKKTVLHYFCENGLKSAAKQVMDQGIDTGVKDADGLSPLWYACSNNHMEMARFLLDKGTSIDARTVVTVCRQGSLDFAKLLFERGATVNMSTDYHTPLTAACSGGNVKVMKFLFDKGASFNTAAEYGWRPLEVACKSNNPQALKCLLEHGASPNSFPKDSSGDSLLHIAIIVGSQGCVDVLLKAGVSVNVTNREIDTPLHIAAEKGYDYDVAVLVKAGATHHFTTQPKRDHENVSVCYSRLVLM